MIKHQNKVTYFFITKLCCLSYLFNFGFRFPRSYYLRHEISADIHVDIEFYFY